MGQITGLDRTQQSFWSLEDMIASESMVRVIDRFVETRDLAALGFTRTRSAETGRPGYAAAPLAKLYIYGYENGIRSSRKLEKETHRNLEVMWLTGYLKPDHSSISDFRRQNIKPIKRLFREFVKLCRDWELTDGKIIAQDGTKISASNGCKNNFKLKTIDERIKRIDEKIAEYLTGMDEADQAGIDNNDGSVPSQTPNFAKLLELLNRKEKYEGYKTQMQTADVTEISTVDPDARMMGSPGKGFDIAHNVQIAVDSKHHIVLDCDVVNNPTDRGEMSKMAKRLKKRRLILPKGRTAYLTDKGYYSGEDLAKMKKLGIKAIVPRQDHAYPKGQPEQFRCTHFQYNPHTNTYTCPMGHILSLSASRKPDPTRLRYHNKAACKQCPHSKNCISGKATFRTVTRSEYTNTYEAADRTYAQNSELYKLRKQLVEHPFGTIKRTMNGGYFLLRTLPKVRGEAALFFLAYNIKRAVNILGFKDIMHRLQLSFPPFYPSYNFSRLVFHFPEFLFGSPVA